MRHQSRVPGLENQVWKGVCLQIKTGQKGLFSAVHAEMLVPMTGLSLLSWLGDLTLTMAPAGPLAAARTADLPCLSSLKYFISSSGCHGTHLGSN